MLEASWVFPLLLLLVPFLIIFVRKSRKIPENQPPLVDGCLPFLGNVIGFDQKRPHFTLTEWAQKYGDIYRFKVLGQNMVVLNSSETVREALITKGDDFAGRPYLFRIHYGFHYGHDIIFGSLDPKWVQMKKCAGHFMRMYTSGVKNVDAIIDEEMETVVNIFTEMNYEDFDPRLILMTAVVNGISASLLGKRYSHDHPLMVEYKSTTRLFSEACSSVSGMELDLFPWLRFLPNETFRKLNLARDQIDHFVDTELEYIQKNLDLEHPQCILDALLLKAQEDEAASDPLGITFQDVRCIFVDVLVSGTLTSSIALSAFVLILAVKQGLQKELQEQVDRVGGRLATLAMRKDMPLVEAAILETLRFISHVPLNLPHFTMCDTEVGGYLIPKDTMVMLNLWAVHHDPRIWENPWEFDPQRFLDSSGELFPPDHITRKSLLPFGAGRRMCLGESLARERLYLFITTILKNFVIQPPQDGSSISCDPRDFDLGLILEPKPFKVRAVPRKTA